MKIIGHPLIPYQNFSKISAIIEIDHILPNTMIWWEASQDTKGEIARFCQENQIPYGVEIQSITELLIYANLEAKYLITSKQHASIFQAIIKEYVLDSLLLCKISDQSEIEALALEGIDGVIFDSMLQ